MLVAAAPPPRGVTDFDAAVRTAGLPRTFDQAVTIFAPSDAGFGALPDGIHARLLRPQSRATLTRVLGYHMVAGSWSIAALRRRIADQGGTLRLETIEGEPLTLSLSRGTIVLTDVNGNTAQIEAGDLRGASGPVHRLDRVMIPRMDAGY